MKKKNKRAFSALFLAPSMILYTLFMIVAIVVTFWYSLTDWDGIGAQKLIGLKNYLNLFSDPDYWVSAGNNLILLVIAVLFQNFFGIVLGYLVSRVGKGYRFFRSVYFLPTVISSAAVGTMFVLLFNSDVGPVNQVLGLMGLKGLQFNWLSDSKTAIYVVAFAQVWQFFGTHFLLYLAAIQSIPNEIIESSLLDGAPFFSRLHHIVIPEIWPIVEVCIILNITGNLKAFDHSWIMTWGGPGVSTSYIAVQMYKTVFMQSGYGYGSAMAMSILFFSLFLILLFRLVSKRARES